MTTRIIEGLTYENAKAIAAEELEIKGHQCIFAELGDVFGYSVLVYKDGKHIIYANDYELHHGYKVREEGKAALRQWYIDTLKRKLFTDEELLEGVTSYEEYRHKDHFLRNFWIMRYEHVSVFNIGKEVKKIKKNPFYKRFPYFNPVCFCYVADPEIVDQAVKYSKSLENGYKKLRSNIEEFRNMVAYELANHEACITGNADEALEALGLRDEDLTCEQRTVVKEELRKQMDRSDY